MIEKYNDKTPLKILGIVTLYYPQTEFTSKNISTYLPYIDKLIIWNNTDKENTIKKELINTLDSKEEKILWKENLENLGLAKAYNFAFDYAKENSYCFILLMDQDSSWNDFSRFIDRAKNEYLSNNISVYTPNIGGYYPQEEDTLYIDFYINSGTILPLDVIEKVGPQDETFKIDALDVDYSIRVRKAGFKIVCFTKYILNHSFGNYIKSKFFHIKSPNYNAYRTYTIVFGHLVVMRKHHKELKLKNHWYFIKELMIYKFIRIVLVEKDKSNKIRKLYQGIRDGLKYKL